MISHNAFAMGPGSCTNQYNGKIVVAKINNGTQTFDPLTNPGVTIKVNQYGSFSVWQVIDLPNQSSLGKITPGGAWYRTIYPNFSEAACWNGHPNENLTRSWTQTYTGYYGLEHGGFGTAVNSAYWTIRWVYSSNAANTDDSTAPSAPTSISAWGMSSSEIVLGWNAPVNYTVTGYKIERSHDGGLHWGTIKYNTGSTDTTYTNSGLPASTTYTYRVSAINDAGTSPPSDQASGTTFYPKLSVNSQDADGNTLSRFNATFSQNGNSVATGLTPVPFYLTNNQEYDLTMMDGGYYAFDHWLDTGSSDRDRTISITSDTTLTAAYKKVFSNLSVLSVDSNNNTITGFKIRLQNGTTINNGTTPAKFVVTIGQNYVIEPQERFPYRFDHWLDTGSSIRDRMVTPDNNDLTLIAVYSNQPASGNDTKFGLAGEWKFENNTLDSSGNNNTGILKGTAGYVPGKVGMALSLDGKTAVDVPDSQLFDAGSSHSFQSSPWDSFSMSLWIKTNQSGQVLLVDHRNNPNNPSTPNAETHAGYSIELNLGRIIASMKDDSCYCANNEANVSSTTLVNDGKFHLIEWVVDRSLQTSKLYVDSGLEGNTSTAAVGSLWTGDPSYANYGSGTYGPVDLFLGGDVYPNSDSNFTGIMDQVRFWDRPLTSAEITSLYNESSQATISSPSGGLGSTSGITLNNVQSTSDTTDSLNQITLSNFNATAGNNRLLVVGVSANNNNVGSITFAGVPLTREVSHFTNNDAEFWYLTNPAGTGDITVTMNGPTQAVVGAYSFSGVNQTVPIPTHITRHNLSPSSPTISITTQYPNDLVLDLPSIWGGVTLGSPTCTQQWNVNVPGQITGASSSIIVPSPATVTCSWTASSDNMWDDAAIELRALG